MEIAAINNYLYDLWNFHLILIGISLSIFTLLYSFILNKRDELRTIAEQIRINGKDPTLSQKETFAVKYILRLKKINQNSIYIFIVSTCLSCWSWVTLRFIEDFRIALKLWFFIIIAKLTIVLCCYVAFQFFKLYKHYLSETRV